MDEAEVAVGGFVVAGCETTGVFEFVEAPLDHFTQRVDGGIDGQSAKPVVLGADQFGAKSSVMARVDRSLQRGVAAP